MKKKKEKEKMGEQREGKMETAGGKIEQPQR